MLPLRTKHDSLTIAHGLPARFKVHVADREGTHAWSFAPARTQDARRSSVDGVETDLRSFEQRSISLSLQRSLSLHEHVYECFATLLSPQGAAPSIVLVAMTRDGEFKNRLRSVRVALFDTASRRLTELLSAPLTRSQDRPIVEALADQSAFRVRLVKGAREAFVFDAQGARSTDATLLEAFDPGPHRCALSKTSRAWIDGRHVVFEDLRTGERRRSHTVLDEGEAPPRLRAISARHVLVLRASKREAPVVVDIETLRVVVLPRAGYVVNADGDGVVMAGSSDQPLTLFDLHTGQRHAIAMGASALVAVTKTHLVCVRDGRFELIARATGSVEDRQCAAMSAIAKIMVSDRGAVCAQDESGLFCWWNDAIDRQCTSAAWPRDRVRSSRVLGWIDGQSTLVVQRSNASSSQLVALAWSDGEPVERWSVEVERAASVAFDESATMIVVEQLGTPALAVYERKGELLKTVATGALSGWRNGQQNDSWRASTHELRVHTDGVIERSSDRGIELYRREGDDVVLCAVSRGVLFISPSDGTEIATEFSCEAERVAPIELALGVLSPSAPPLPHFEEVPERRMLCASVQRCSLESLREALGERRRSKGLWLAEHDEFSSLDRVTAVAIAPNAQWGAIGTRRGHVIRFAITPKEPSETRDPWAS
ncbi:MAG: hypothetical protein U0269_04640 [Polyangiales bacterium]